MIETQFKRLGFNSSETAAYLSLSEIGSCSAQILARRLGIPRTTAYSILDNLLSKGLVRVEQQKRSTQYVANRPEILLRLLENEQRELEHKRGLATQVVDLLTPYFASGVSSVPKLQFYESREAVRQMLADNSPLWHDSVKKFDSIWWGYQDTSFVEHYMDWLHEHWASLSAQERVQLISNQSETEERLRGQVENREIRQLLSQETFSSTIWVLGDYIVLIMSRQQPHYAFQLQEPVFAANLRQLFQLLWGMSTPLDS